MNVVLIGYRGSGKSTVGRALARRLGWAFVDTDALIEERTGQTIREIFADQAEQGFRDLETQVVAEVSRLDRHVISTGGGAILRPVNVETLRACGKLVYLTAPPELLWKRIFDDVHRHTTRLRMDPDRGLQEVRQALAEREPLYAAASDCEVDTADRDVDSIVGRILTRTGLSPA
jgi:shikimate kinase